MRKRGISALAGICGGILIGLKSCGSARLSLLLPAIFAMVGIGMFILLIWNRRRSPMEKGSNISGGAGIAATAAIVMVFGALGDIATVFSLPEDLHCRYAGTYEVRGKVLTSHTTAKGERLGVELISLKDSLGQFQECRNERLLLFSDNHRPLMEGSEITFKGRLKPLLHVSDPRLKTTGRNIGEISETTSPSAVSEYFQKCRLSFVKAIDLTDLTSSSKAMLKGVLIGEKGGMNDEMKEGLGEAGLMHMLAVSGMHTGIIAGILLYLLFPLNLLPWHHGRHMVCAVGVWAFVVFTGGSLSAIRAATMLTMGALTRLGNRLRDGFIGVVWTCVIILLFSPLSLFEIGFQLSALCVIALTLFVDKLNPFDRQSTPISHRVASIILVSMVAMGATGILSAYYFHSFPTLFLLANLVVLPFLPIYMMLGLVYILSSCLGLNIGIIGELIDGMTGFVISLLEAFRGAAIHIHPAQETVLATLGALAVLAYFLNRKKIA